MGLKFYSAASSKPGQVALMATSETWRSLAERLATRSRGSEAIRAALTRVTAQLKESDDASVLRLTFPVDQAELILANSGD